VQDVSFSHNVQTDSGAHPASYPVRIGVLSRGGGGIKRQRLESDRLLPRSAQVKNARATLALPLRLQGIVLN
jgi:hypothetical protein